MLLRSCDVDAEHGPLEVPEEEWDGLSVWLGRIPSHCVCRAGGAEALSALSAESPAAQRDKRPSAELFRGDWALADRLLSHLDALGEGLAYGGMGSPQAAVSQQPTSGLGWALLAYKNAEDSRSLLWADEKKRCDVPGWVDPDTGQPYEVLLKRALPAEQVKADLEGLEAAERERRATLELAVARIFSWLKREGKSLNELFTKIDTDGSGDFDEREFRAGMFSIGLAFDDNTIKAIFSFMDSDDEGTVDTAEFIANMQSFGSLMGESAASILLALCLHLDKANETIKDLFRRVGKEVSLVEGPTSLVEFEQFSAALLAVDIQHSPSALTDVMASLDVNCDGELSLFELTARLGAYRRRRRHVAAKVLVACSVHIKTTGQNATRVFAKSNHSGTGELDPVEFNEVMRRMGQTMTTDATNEVMAEIDLDGGGSIHVNEFLDKVRQSINERHADEKRCKQLFDECDEDGSGALDEQEMVCVCGRMGLAAHVAHPPFIKQMMTEIERLAAGATAAELVEKPCENYGFCIKTRSRVSKREILYLK